MAVGHQRGWSGSRSGRTRWPARLNGLRSGGWRSVTGEAGPDSTGSRTTWPVRLNRPRWRRCQSVTGEGGRVRGAVHKVASSIESAAGRTDGSWSTGEGGRVRGVVARGGQPGYRLRSGGWQPVTGEAGPVRRAVAQTVRPQRPTTASRTPTGPYRTGPVQSPGHPPPAPPNPRHPAQPAKTPRNFPCPQPHCRYATVAPDVRRALSCPRSGPAVQVLALLGTPAGPG